MKLTQIRRICLLLFLVSFSLYAQAPKREFRGAWIASVVNLDWPASNTATPDAQRAQLVSMLDALQSSGITAVMFQVRPECDALYPSSLEPWSYWLTGQQGVAPNPLWDPLQFAVDETHKRGMEIHAWFNPYRAIRDTTNPTTRAPNHVSNVHPEWILKFNGIKLRILNPGIPAVREFVTSVVMDVVRRYDVDGVHFDDYFYPYPEGSFTKISTEDAATFTQYPRGFSNIDDWRRDNVNLQMKMVHDSIQAVKPYVKLGISPFGIWKNGVPAGITGLDAYSVIYGDAIAWLRQHTIDYLTPQLYWRIGGGQDYSKLMPWWADSTFAYNTHLYTGHIWGGSYSTSELPNQVRLNRANPKTGGSVFFRAAFFVSNSLGFADTCRQNLYRSKALLPIMAWKDNVPPFPPRGITYAPLATNGLPAIQWQLPIPASDGDSASRYVVYRFDHVPSIPAELADPANILSIEGARYSMPAPPPGPGPYYYYATALDRNYNESIESLQLVLSAPQSPVLMAPANGASALPESVLVRWHASPLAAAYHLQISSDPTFATGIVVNDSLGTDTARVIRSLPGQTTYYWRVSAMNAGGTGAYSAAFSFATGFPLAATLVYPTNFMIDVPVDVQFRWNRASAATVYQFQLSKVQDFSVITRDTVGLSDTTYLAAGLPNYTIFYWRVKASNAAGSAAWSQAFKMRTVIATSVAEEGEMPREFGLEQNYPNPFNPITTIKYTVGGNGAWGVGDGEKTGTRSSGLGTRKTRLIVYDLLGRQVATLVDEAQAPGTYQVQFDASGLASGVYIYRLTAGSFVQSRTMVLVK